LPFSAVRGGRCDCQFHDCVLAAVDCPFISTTLGTGQLDLLQLCRSGRISWADMVLAPSVAGLFKWRQFEPEVILLAIGWYLRFSLFYRNVEELLAERGLCADHVTVWRWSSGLLRNWSGACAGTSSRRTTRGGWTRRVNQAGVKLTHLGPNRDRSPEPPIAERSPHAGMWWRCAASCERRGHWWRAGDAYKPYLVTVGDWSVCPPFKLESSTVPSVIVTPEGIPERERRSDSETG
jgi:hypothetical protein